MRDEERERAWGGQGRGEEDRVRVALVGLQGWSGIREGLGRRGRGWGRPLAGMALLRGEREGKRREKLTRFKNCKNRNKFILSPNWMKPISKCLE